VYDEFLSRDIVRSCSLHLWSVVTISEFGEAEAPHDIKAVNTSHEWKMSFSMQGHKTSSEQIVLDSEFGSQTSIDLTKHLVSSKQVNWVVIKIKYGKQFGISNSLNSSVCEISLFVKSQ